PPPVVIPNSSFNSQSVFAGASATFTITVTGDAPLVYQWRQDGADLPSQTNKTLRIGSTQPPNEGGYDVMVSNASGSVTTRSPHEPPRHQGSCFEFPPLRHANC